jgi:hypothetical protein
VIGTRLYESHPPRYEYFLTDKGMALGPVLKARWAPRLSAARAGSQFDCLREHRVLKSDSHRVFVAPQVAALGH